MYVDDQIYGVLLSKVRGPKDYQLRKMIVLIYEFGQTVRGAYEAVLRERKITLRALQIRMNLRSQGLIRFTDLYTSHRLNNPGKYQKKVKLL